MPVISKKKKPRGIDATRTTTTTTKSTPTIAPTKQVGTPRPFASKHTGRSSAFVRCTEVACFLLLVACFLLPVWFHVPPVCQKSKPKRISYLFKNCVRTTCVDALSGETVTVAVVVVTNECLTNDRLLFSLYPGWTLERKQKDPLDLEFVGPANDAHGYRTVWIWIPSYIPISHDSLGHCDL